MPNARPPRIGVPGRGKGRSIPQGYIVGRTSQGRGPLELINPNATSGAFGLASKQQVGQQLAVCGFRFFVGGAPLAGEMLGSGNWGHPVLFENGQTPDSVISSLTIAAASDVFSIKALIAGLYVTIGTITFANGANVGVLNWPAPVTVATGVAVSLWAPPVRDVSLSNITGAIYGSAA